MSHRNFDAEDAARDVKALRLMARDLIDTRKQIAILSRLAEALYLRIPAEDRPNRASLIREFEHEHDEEVALFLSRGTTRLEAAGVKTT